ncbi:MAG: hypothetical protein R6U96_13480 [Promethearchaeia archaeon]
MEKTISELRKRNIICIFTILLLIFEFTFLMSLVLAREEEVSGYSKEDTIHSNENVLYRFSNDINLGMTSDVHTEVDITYEKSIQNRHASIMIRNNETGSSNDSLALDIDNRESMKEGYGFSKAPDAPKNNRKQFRYRYNSIFRLTSNSSINKFTFRFEKNSQYGLEADKGYTIAVFTEGGDSWESISTEEISENSTTYLEASFTDISSDTQYYFTVYEEEQGIFGWIWPLIIIGIIGLVGLVLILSKKEYIQILKRRTTPVDKGSHRLSLEEVLENENRSTIIDLILENPGVHFNELLRETELSPGNLVWHLDILEKYEIIGKKHISNYVVYFPYYQKNPISNLDLKLRKSELTLKVLELIEEKPGLWNNKMADIFDVDHKTTKYHLDKLMELNLIFAEKDGRKKKYYPNLENEYFNNSD